MIKASYFTNCESDGGAIAARASLRGGSSVLAIGCLLASASAFAQVNPAATETEVVGEPAADDSNNAIVVSGIRQSLENSQNIKRQSDTVVDAITSEDIGALPDRSVTEALQRVPGVAINRFAGSNDPDHFSVEGSGVVIRGLNFVRSEFNGRDAFAAGVGGQALNFADVSPELLGSVIISKNSTADMIEGGLAGTVNLITRKPFDKDGFHIAFSAEANYGDFRKEWTPTGSILISNTWDTGIGRIGLLGNASYSQIKSRADGLQITNFQTRDNTLVRKANAGETRVCRNPLPGTTDNSTLPPGNSPCGTASGPGADGFADFADIRYAPLGGQFRSQDFNRKRDGLAFAAQWESIDEKTLLTAQFIRSHSTNSWGEYAFETAPDQSEYGTQPFGCQQNGNGPVDLVSDGRGGLMPDPNNTNAGRAQCAVGQFQDYAYDEGNLFQSGYITNPTNGWRGAPNDFIPIGGLQQSLARRQVLEETTNTDYGLNLETQLTDRLHLSLDGNYTSSRKENLDVSVFGSTWADQELDLTGNLPTVIPHKPNYLSYSWQGSPPPVTPLTASTDDEYFRDQRVQFWRAAMDHIEESTGSQYTVRGDLTYEFDETAFLREVKIGARYADRDQTVRYTTYNWGALSEIWAGNDNVSLADFGGDQTDFYEFPDFFRGQTPGPIGGYFYNGDLLGDYQGSSEFFKSINQQWQNKGGNAGWVPLAERGGAVDGSPFLNSDIQPIGQRDSSAYIMARFNADGFGDGNLRIAGNIGVRYVTTQVTSSGQLGVGNNQQLNINQTFLQRCGGVITLPDGSTRAPGGICSQGEAAYVELQAFADGTTNFDQKRNNYDYFLPSFNIRFGMSDDIILRFAASKVLTRPDNSYLRNFLNVGLDAQGNLSAQAGNPNMLPATAWQFDATAEWYFAPVGSLTFNAFYKDIRNFFFQSVRSEQFTNNGITRDILVRGPDNFDGKGKVKGFEVAYQQTYDFLPGMLSGLGASANYTYIDSSGLPNAFLNGGLGNSSASEVPTGNLPLEQLSKHNFNVAAFYEKGPVSVRAAYNWRSRFLLTASDVIFPYFSIFNESTGQLDASAFFNVSDQIKVGVQGVNLLNEVTKTSQAYTGDPALLAPRSFFMNDRRFSFIVRGNF